MEDVIEHMAKKKNTKMKQLNIRVSKQDKVSLQLMAEEYQKRGLIKKNTISEFIRMIPRYLDALFEHLEDKDNAILSLIEKISRTVPNPVILTDKLKKEYLKPLLYESNRVVGEL